MHISEIKVLGKDPVQQEEGFGLQGELQVQLLQGRSGAADDLRVRAMLAFLQGEFPAVRGPRQHRHGSAIAYLQNPPTPHCQKRSPFNFLTSKNTFQET